MDIMTGARLLAGIIVIAVMMFMGGDLHMFISEHAMIIIFGGSIAATMIRFPLGVMLHGLPLGAKFAFTMSRLSARDLVDELARIAEIARKQGPVGLEKLETDEPFLSKGIRYVADGYDLGSRDPPRPATARWRLPFPRLHQQPLCRRTPYPALGRWR